MLMNPPSQSPSSPGNDEALRAMLKSQYRAALAMLRDAIDQCPDDLWYDDTPTNAYWQVAYHALFFAHLYMQRNVESFQPWEHHQGNVQHEDGIAGRRDPDSDLPLIPNPYSKAEALAYWDHCDAMVEDAIDALDLWSVECGFSWYKVPKLEHQFVNLRHIQHHTAQLADRLRAAASVGVKWVGARSAKQA